MMQPDFGGKRAKKPLDGRRNVAAAGRAAGQPRGPAAPSVCAAAELLSQVPPAPRHSDAVTPVAPTPPLALTMRARRLVSCSWRCGGSSLNSSPRLVGWWRCRQSPTSQPCGARQSKLLAPSLLLSQPLTCSSRCRPPRSLLGATYSARQSEPIKQLVIRRLRSPARLVARRSRPAATMMTPSTSATHSSATWCAASYGFGSGLSSGSPLSLSWRQRR